MQPDRKQALEFVAAMLTSGGGVVKGTARRSRGKILPRLSDHQQASGIAFGDKPSRIAELTAGSACPAPYKNAVSAHTVSDGAIGLREPSVPLADLNKDLRRGRHILGSTGVDLGEANLQRRLDLFKWLLINRSGNVFRYAKEREALAAL